MKHKNNEKVFPSELTEAEKLQKKKVTATLWSGERSDSPRLLCLGPLLSSQTFRAPSLEDKR